MVLPADVRRSVSGVALVLVVASLASLPVAATTPRATDDSAVTNEDVAVTINLLANDYDYDGDTVAFVAVTKSPGLGQVSVTAAGVATYTPGRNVNGQDLFRYLITDGKGHYEEARVVITIVPVADAPDVAADQASTREDQPVTVNVLTNDTDPDQGRLSISQFTQPASGRITYGGDGVFTYTPNPRFRGVDTFSYTAINTSGRTATAQVLVTVLPVNRPPAATADAYRNGTEDQPLAVAAGQGVLANDVDLDGDTLTASLVTAPAHGSLTLNQDGSFRYMPQPNFNGNDTFRYRVFDGTEQAEADVQLTVAPVNDAPTTLGLPTRTYPEDAIVDPIDLTPVFEDVDLEPAPPRFTLVSNSAPSLLTATLQGTPPSRLAIVLQPHANGTANLRLRATDTGGLFVETTFTVIVSPVQQAPEPVADLVTTAEDTPVTFNVLANDVDLDGDSLKATATSDPAHGVLVQNLDGTFTYTPALNYSGPDSFTYRASDGLSPDPDPVAVTITVTPVDDPPVAGTLADLTVAEDSPAVTIDLWPVFSDVDDATEALEFSVASNSAPAVVDATVPTRAPRRYLRLAFQPDANGAAVITVKATDPAGLSAQTTFTVTVTPVDDPPLARDDQVVTAEDTPVRIDVLANDVNVDADLLTVTLVAAPGHGSAVPGADGAFTYTPAPDYSGPDNLRYTVTDGLTPSPEATVAITVLAVNDPPAVTNPGLADLTLMEDAAETLVPLSPAFSDVEDPGSALLVFAAVGNSNPGLVTATVSRDNNGQRHLSLRLVPDASGQATLTVRATDTGGLSAQTSFVLTVLPVNDPPSGVADTATTAEDTPVRIPVLANDRDLEGTPLAIASFDQRPPNGTVTDNGDGTLTYTPASGFSGTNTFSYQATDGLALSGEVLVTVTVVPVNQAPTTVGLANLAMDEDAPDRTVDLFAAFADNEDADAALTFTVVRNTNPRLVTASVGGDTPRQLVLHLAPDAFGIADLTVQATDTDGLSVQAAFTLAVAPVNDAPLALPDSASTGKGTPVRIPVLGNDTDTEGTPLSVAAVDTATPPATHGSVALNADGSLTYTPPPGFSGEDHFAYQATDGLALSDPAIVTVTVRPTNTAPTTTGLPDLALDEDAPDALVALLPAFADTEDAAGLTFAVPRNTNPGLVTPTVTGTSPRQLRLHLTPDSSGSADLTVRATDSGGLSVDASFALTARPVNDPPLAVDDSVTTSENTAVRIRVLDNDTDVDGDALALATYAGPANGTVTDNRDGTLSYAPVAGFSGTDTFTYRATDGLALSGTATVTVKVGAADQPPTTTGIADLTVNEDAADQTVDLFAAFADAEDADTGLTFTVSRNTSSRLVTATVVGNNPRQLNLRLAANGSGTADLAVRATDSVGQFVEAPFTLTVRPVNDPPVAVDDSAWTNGNTAVRLPVLDNDTDLDGNALAVATFSAPANGLVTRSPDGALVYTPTTGFSGTDAFTYQATDGLALSDPAAVTVTVGSADQAPTTAGIADITVDEDAADPSVDLFVAFADAEDADAVLTFTVARNSNPTLVRATVAGTNPRLLVLRLTPDGFGVANLAVRATDSLGQSVETGFRLVVRPVNDPPVAVADSATTEQSTPVTIPVLANDTDVEAAPLAVAAHTVPPNGAVTRNGDGSLTYTPVPGFSGTDTFSYRATDGLDLSDRATVTVRVGGVDQPPTTTGLADLVIDEDAPDQAVDLVDAFADAEDADSALTFTVLNANPGLVAATVGAVSPRQLVLHLTPDASGTAPISVRATDTAGQSVDASFRLTVNPVNDAPVATADAAATAQGTAVRIAVLANDTDAEGAVLKVATFTAPANGVVTANADGSLTYTPVAGFSGPDTFTYQATDGLALTDPTPVTVTVGTVDQPPTTSGIADLTVNEDAADTDLDLFAAFADAEDADELLTFTLTGNTNPALVAAAVTGGTPRQLRLQFVPNGSGAAGLAVRATDSAGQSVETTFTVTVLPVNDAPEAVADAATTPRDTAVRLPVLANDRDPEATPLRIATFTAPGNGAVTNNGDGTVTYTPATGFSGVDTFTYQASDGLALAAPATVTVTVTAVDQPPTTTGIDNLVVDEDAADQTVDLFAAFADAEDGDAMLTFTVVRNPNPTLVTATVTGNNPRQLTLRFVPNAWGLASLTVRASDTVGQTIDTTFAVGVRPVNDAPVATTDSATTTEDTLVVIPVLANDTDVEQSALAVATFTAPGTGTVTANADGSLAYTPAPGFSGTDTFTYQATDGQALSNPATVTVRVGATDQPPTTTGLADITVDEDAADQAVDLFAAFADAEDADTALTLTVTRNTNPGLVTASVIGANPRRLNLHLAPDGSGVAGLTVRAADTAGQSVEAGFTLTVVPINDAPVTVADTAATPRNTAVRIPVLGNDRDPEGTPLVVAAYTAPTNGTVTDAGDGTLTYTPATGFSGTDTFTYQATDGLALSAVTTATVRVGATDQAPTTSGIVDITVTEDAADQTVDLFAAFADAEDADAALTFLVTTRSSNPNLVTATITGANPRQLTLRLGANESGTATITVRALDSVGQGVDATFTLTVRPVNDAPVAAADSATTRTNTPVRLSPLANDRDVEGSPLSLATVTAPANGTVVKNADGSLTYTPATGFNGLDTFTYQVSDGLDLSNLATVSVRVGAADLPPTTTGIADITVDEDAADQTVDLFAAFADTEDADAALSFTVTNSNPGLVTATVGTPAPRQLNLHLAANASGTARLVVRATDTAGQSVDAAFTLTVNPVNDAPVAVADSATTTQATAVRIPVLTNDTDVEGSPLKLATVTAPANGSVTANADGSVTYTPVAAFTGLDTFTYQASDGLALSAAATVGVRVNAANQPPTTTGIADITVDEDAPDQTVDLFAAFADAEDADTALTFTVPGNTNPGLVTATVTGTSPRRLLLRLTPNASGLASLTVRASDTRGQLADTTFSVTVRPVNDPPVAVADSATTAEDTDVTIPVLANDTDVEGDTLRVVGYGYPVPSSGWVSIAADGRTVTYTPMAGFTGSDSFGYSVSDGNGGYAQATVAVSVAVKTNTAPVAVADVYTLDASASVTLSIGIGGPAPGSVLANDRDAENDLLTAALASTARYGYVAMVLNGTFNYRLDDDHRNYRGTDSFTYVASDGSLSSRPATVTINVVSIPDAVPVAVDDTFATSAGVPLRTAAPGVLRNDLDTDLDSLIALQLTAPTKGTLAFYSNGSFTYTPNAGATGTDSFTYEVSDGVAKSAAPATVTIDIRAVDDPPTVAAALSDLELAEDDPATAATPDLYAVFDDPDDADAALTLAVTGNTNPALFTSVSISAAVPPELTVEPAPNANGTADITVRATDPAGRFVEDTVHVTVAAVDDPPVARDDSAATARNTAVSIAVLRNDTDLEGSALTVDVATLGVPANGTATANADGTVTYTPAVGFAGVDTFNYQASDGGALSAPATVTVTVTAATANAVPVVTDDAAATLEDTPVTIAVLANDFDPNGDAISVAALALPANGTVVSNPDGTLSYVPARNWNGVDTFTYQATDGIGLSAAATVTVTVTAANDAPVAENDLATTSAGTPVTIAVLANDSDIEGDAIFPTSLTQPANGSVRANSAGTVTYTPVAGFTGADAFTYRASDGAATSAAATVTVSVALVPANGAPVAVADTATTPEDTPITFSLTANDTDPEGDALSIAVLTQPANGKVVNNGNSSVTYTPAADFNGRDTFFYRITDGSTLSTRARVTVTVTPVNDPPTAGDDRAATTVDTPVGIAVLANDSDVDGDDLAVSGLTQPAHGTVVANPDGTVTYTPAAGYTGADAFTYQASDGVARSAAATVTVLVTAAPANGAPTAVADTATTVEETALRLDLIANDTDPEGDRLRVAMVTQPGHGMVTSNGDGTVTYTPAVDYSGLVGDTFTYQVSDGIQLSAPATVTVVVTPLNDAPVAADDAAVASWNTPANIAVLTNDLDADGDTLLVSGLTQPAHGATVANADGTVTYTPADGFSGVDTFTYQASDGELLSRPATVGVTVSPAPVNGVPVAQDDAATTREDTAVTFDLLANDSDPDGDPVTMAVLNQPSQGLVADNGDGTVSYRSTLDFSGTDTFTYQVTDGASLSAPATVTVTVTPVNDPPVAVADSAVATAGVPTGVAVLANDTDVDSAGLAVSGLTQPANGTTVANPDGTVTYTAAARFRGTDSFTYRASDGAALSAVTTVTVTVNAANTAPTAVADAVTTLEDTRITLDLVANDSDPQGDPLAVAVADQPANGTVVIAGGAVDYTPASDFTGVDTFTYQVSDGAALSAPATVTVTVSAVNDAPVARDDSATTTAGTPVVVAVLANDADVDSAALFVSSLTQPSHGVATVNADGSITYAPAAGFTGADAFSYRASDGSLLSARATVSITVAPTPLANVAPLAVADAATTLEDTPVTVELLANDTDPDSDALALATVTQPAQGTVVANPDGTITYAPAPDGNGTDTFTYQVTDGTALSAPATVTVVVSAVNDAPVARADAAATPANTPATIPVLANDADADGDALFVSGLTQPGHGTVAHSAGDTVLYTPDTDFTGIDTFTYQASDGAALSTVTTVTLTVTAAPANRAPVAAADAATTPEDTPVVLDLLANDSDPDGDAVSVAVVGTPANGLVVSQAGGNIAYRPDPDFAGTDTFTYRITDGTELSTRARVTITVTPVNDPPVARDDSASTAAGTAATIPVLANDTDVDSPALTVSTLTQPANGTTIANADGTVTYRPAPGFTGTETFSYRAADGAALSAVATVTITVTPANAAPVALPDSAVTAEETPVTFSLTANDTDADGDPVRVAVVNQPIAGTVLSHGDGTVTYVPGLDFNGSETFTYRITDGITLSAPVTATVTVGPVNDPPVARDDTATASAGLAVPIAVLANDTDVDSAALVVSGLTQPAHGTTVANADGTVTYTSAVGFSGPDSFTYRASDGAAVSAVATVTVAVASANAVPVVADDAVTTLEDTPVSLSPLTNDSDPDGDPVSVAVVDPPANGSVTRSGTTLTYTPAPNFNGTDSFAYQVTDGVTLSPQATVTITVSPVNDPPVAVDDVADTPKDAEVTIPVLTNDTDPETASDALSISGLTQPAHGTTVANTDGTVTYAPETGFVGTDTFTYLASDGAAVSAPATVTVTVTPANAAPVAEADSATTFEDTPVTLSLTANDHDPDGDSISVAQVSPPASGRVLSRADGTITFVPAPDANGTVTFDYQITDGVALSAPAPVTITVTPVNDPPVAADDVADTAENAAVSVPVLDNDTDLETATRALSVSGLTQPAHGTAVATAAGRITYTPAAGFTGTDTFTYRASDGAAVSAPATVTVTVAPANRLPVAEPDSATTPEDTPVTLGLVANDHDPDEDPVAVAVVQPPAHGLVVHNGDGTITYTPLPDFNGSESFAYQVSDGVDLSGPATVTITVTPVNDAPVARDDKALASGEAIDVLANDSDVDGDALTVSGVTQPVHGTAAANANGTITYTPTPGYVGTDAFTYQASDGTALSAPATVTLEVRPLNQAPTTTGLPSLVLNEDERDPADTTGTVWRRVDLLSAFEDKEDADSALRFAVTTNSMPALFSAVRVETGTLLLVFPPDANGTAVLMVRATDTGGASVETPLTVTVKPVNDPPLADDDTTTFDWPSTTAVTIAVLANDVDPDGNDAPKPATVAIVRQALAGQAKANADGTVLYTADAGFPGVDTFSYTVSDAAGATSATATVTVGAAAGWEFGLSLAGTALAIGMHKDASDGLDPFLDLPANLPPQGGNTAVRASLLPDAAGTELARDYRGLAAAATWLLEVVNPSQDTTAVLTWNQGAPQAKQLYLIQVGADGVSVPNGVSVAMHEIGSATVPANGTCYFTISFGVATFEMRLQTGWNLVSVPVQPLDASTAAVFAGATEGQPWRWSGSEYRVADRIQPLVGYWVVHQGEPVTVVIRGTPVLGTAATVNQGWNLVGPLADIDIPASNAAKVDSIYWYADGSYRLAKPYEAGKTPAQNAADRNGLIRGFGYWLYGLQPTSLRLE